MWAHTACPAWLCPCGPLDRPALVLWTTTPPSGKDMCLPWTHSMVFALRLWNLLGSVPVK